MSSLIIGGLSTIGSGLIVIIAILDSTVFLGFLVPGQTFVLMLGGLVTAGVLSFTKTVTLVAIGAMLGDIISYSLGRYTPQLLLSSDGPKNKNQYVTKGAEYIKRSLIFALILDRFILPWRPIIPFVAGTMRIERYKVFVPAFILDIVFALIFVSAGYLIGKGISIIAILSGPKISTGIITLIIVTIVWFATNHTVRYGKSHLVLVQKIFRVLGKYISQLPTTKWFVTKFYHLSHFIKRRLSVKSVFGLPLTLALVVGVLLLTTLFELIIDVKTDQQALIDDIALNRFFYIHQVSYMTTIMLLFTALANKYVVTILLLLTGWILYVKKLSYLITPFFITVIGAVVTTHYGKLVIMRPRPEFTQIVESSYSFPSGHATAAMALFGIIGFLLVRYSYSWSVKVYAVYGSVFLITAIGFSRVYLGVHYLSDVLAGFLVGGLWLLIGVSLILWLEYKQNKN
jgi:undecaprenyl-diphosphatase